MSEENGEVERMEGRGKMKVLVKERRWRGEYLEGENRRKNDPIDRLYSGLRINVPLSPVFVVSPTNHKVTSTGQYYTLKAS